MEKNSELVENSATRDDLVDQLLAAVRSLIAAGENRSDIEGLVVQELLRDD